METIIKKHYNDALYFASSYINENEAFYLTPFEYKVILKLINYSKKQEYITWSSASMSIHMMEKEGAIQKAIERLTRKTFLESTTSTISKGKGTVVKRRKLRINWELLEDLLAKFKDYNTTQPTELDEELDEMEVEIEEPVEVEVVSKPVNNELKEELTAFLEENCSSYVARVPIQELIDGGKILTEKEIIKLIPYKYKKETI